MKGLERDEGLVELLEKALTPWLPDGPEPICAETFQPRTSSMPLQELERRRLEAYARAKLAIRSAELAAIPTGGGRNEAAFKLAAGIGRFVHHGVIREQEAVAAIIEACNANALVKEDGKPSVLATIASGLRKARADPLPELSDRSEIRRKNSVGAHKSQSAVSDARAAENGGNAPRIRLVAFKDICLSARRRYLIAGLMPSVGIIVVWGPPKCGKSFWVFDAMMHVALGWDYRHRRVRQGPVVYCAFEGQIGLEGRVEAFRQRFLAEEPEAPPFYLEPATINLVMEHEELIAVIQRQLTDTKPVAVVLDTLNRSMQGSESSDQDMSDYVKAADTIREAFECVVIIVHHCGIERNRPRGHTSLTGAADAQLAVKRDGANNIIVEVEHAKDGPQGDIIASRLEVVDVGRDEDEQLIQSCVIMPVDGNGIAAPKARRKLPASAQIALKALEKALQEGEEPGAGQSSPNTKAVTRSMWRRFFDAMVVDRSDKEAARRMAFARAVERLVAEGLASVWNDRCSLIQQNLDARKLVERTDEQNPTSAGPFGGVQGRTNTNTPP